MAITAFPKAASLKLTAAPAPTALKLVCALVCATSVGTVELLYANDQLLLTSAGEVFTVPRNVP